MVCALHYTTIKILTITVGTEVLLVNKFSFFYDLGLFSTAV